eukprot:7090610-Prymnesium_polylepis.1
MAAARTTPWSRLSAAAAPREALPVRTICVIGAGPSGLVAAKHLRDAGYTVWVLGEAHSAHFVRR